MFGGATRITSGKEVEKVSQKVDGEFISSSTPTAAPDAEQDMPF